MDEEREKEVTPEREEEKTVEVSQRAFKEAEYHKPPDIEDNPPPPSPPAKEASDKD